jgi:hypothetical protein
LLPVRRQEQEVADADLATTVEVGRAVLAIGAGAPGVEQREKNQHADGAVAVDVGRMTG